MKKLSFILGLFILVCCEDDSYREGDFFFLINKEAKMPVVVRGNKTTGIFILFVHGGPGGTSLQKIGLPAFNDLEKSYATVFWDQRGSGSSQGNGKNDLLTLPQFVEDLDKLIDLIRFKYNNPEIFLMGHSWGGCLGTAYLSDASRQTKIQGWIEVDGAHNNPKGDSLSLSWITGFAQQQAAQHVESDFWNYVLNWYKKNPNFTSNQLEHYAFLEKADGYVHDPTVPRTPATYPGYPAGYVFNSPADITMALTNENHVISSFLISDIDLTPQMKNITLPSLIVWGQFDGVIPVAMATHAMNSLGTPVFGKRLVVLPNSGHVGFYEEPELFAASVRQFINQYK
jgi:pimeloyl-ACP methyl ester carboxylesterase